MYRISTNANVEYRSIRRSFLSPNDDNPFFFLAILLGFQNQEKKMYSFNSCSHVGTQTDPPVLSSRHVLGPNSRALGKGMCCCVAGK